MDLKRDSLVDQGSLPTESNGALQLQELLLAPDEVSEPPPHSLLVASKTSGTSGSGTEDVSDVSYSDSAQEAISSSDIVDLAAVKSDEPAHKPTVDLANAPIHAILKEPNTDDIVVRVGLRQKGKLSKRHRAHDTHINNSPAKEIIVKVKAPILANSSADKELVSDEITPVAAACTEQSPWSAITVHSRHLLLFIVTIISAFSIQKCWSSFLDSYTSYRSRTPLSSQQNSTWLQKRDGALFVLNLSLPSNAVSASISGELSITPQHGKAVTRSKILDPGSIGGQSGIESDKQSPHYPYDLVQWVVTGDTVTFGTDISRQALIKGLPENVYFLWTKDSKNVSVKAHDPAFPYLTLQRVGSQDAGRYRLFMCSGSQSLLLTETLLRISSKSYSPSIARL